MTVMDLTAGYIEPNARTLRKHQSLHQIRGTSQLVPGMLRLAKLRAGP